MSELQHVVAADHPREGGADVARFGAFELDIRNRELRRDGVKIKLQDQPLRLLVFFVQNAGEIVTREQLQQRLWPAEFVDFDHSLNAAIRKLRSALDDAADNPRFVETVARRGYRFIAPVSWRTATAVAAKPRSRWPLIAGITLAIIALAIGAFVIVRQRMRRPWLNVIAVLPFNVDDKRNEQLADGLTETLIDNISRLPKLRVLARTTVFRFKGNNDIERIARELNVEGIVTGRIRRDRDGYSVRVELIDATDGTQIWGDEFKAREGQVPSLQNQIAEELSLQLKRGLDRNERLATGTKDSAAYELYTRGLYAWNKRTNADLDRALQYFNRAAEIDPQFARAYAGIANVYGVRVGYGDLAPEVGVPKILAAAQRALELDPNNAEALTSIATTKYRNLWDFAGAERDYRRAIASNPNYAIAHQWYADYLRSMGRPIEARREAETAYKLDPFASSTNAMMCYAYYFDGQYDQAIAFSRKAEELDPQLGAHKCVMVSLLAKGDTDAAVEQIRRLYGIAPNGAAALQDAYRRGGKSALNRAWLELLLRLPNAEIAAPVEIAQAYVAVGDKDRAFEWLEKAFRHRVSRLTGINYDPAFAPLRSDPRYSNLLQRIGLPLL